MMKVLAILTIVLLILTLGCGFAIRYGGEEFRNGIKGHMILGIATFISMILLTFAVFRQ